MFSKFTLKRNRPVVQTAEPAIQAWLWIYQTQYSRYTVRLLFLGNEHIAPAEHENWPKEQYHTYLVFRRQVTDSAHSFTRSHNFEPLIRMYPNYIAFELPREVEAGPVINCVLEALRDHMGWDDIPALQRINSREEFSKLNDKHDNRWHLGSYQLGSR
jgi:hypothetical protein